MPHLVNGALVAVALFIFVETFERFRSPPAAQGPLMLVVASGGLLVNACCSDERDARKQEVVRRLYRLDGLLLRMRVRRGDISR